MQDKEFLMDIVRTKMPYGKYKGWFIADVPENYLVWMKGKGFSTDKIGLLLQTAYEIKLNGLDDILTGLKKLK